jgi:hypothetical protein
LILSEETYIILSEKGISSNLLEIW